MRGSVGQRRKQRDGRVGGGVSASAHRRFERSSRPLFPTLRGTSPGFRTARTEHIHAGAPHLASALLLQTSTDEKKTPSPSDPSDPCSALLSGSQCASVCRPSTRARTIAGALRLPRFLHHCLHPAPLGGLDLAKHGAGKHVQIAVRSASLCSVLIFELDYIAEWGDAMAVVERRRYIIGPTGCAKPCPWSPLSTRHSVYISTYNSSSLSLNCSSSCLHRWRAATVGSDARVGSVVLSRVVSPGLIRAPLHTVSVRTHQTQTHIPCLITKGTVG